MTTMLVVLGLAGMMALLRLGGFTLAGRDLPEPVERALSGLMIATLSGLIVTSTAGVDQPGAAASALLLATICSWCWRRLWLTLAFGMAAFTFIARLLHEEVHL